MRIDRSSSVRRCGGQELNGRTCLGGIPAAAWSVWAVGKGLPRWDRSRIRDALSRSALRAQIQTRHLECV
jgi:hypothetical protein